MVKNIVPSIITNLSLDRDRFILWLPVLLGLGIGFYFCFPFEPDIKWVTAIFLMLCLLLRLLWRLYLWRLVLLALLIASFGFLRAEIRTWEIEAPILHNQLFFRGVEGRISDIQIKEKGEKLILTDVHIEHIQEKTTPKRISISLRKVEDGLLVGDRVHLYAMLFPPPMPSMPGSYDFARMFYYEQLGAVGYSVKPPEIIEKSDPTSFEQRLNSFRLTLTERILAPMTPENGWIAAAMMTGEMSGVTKDVADTMRDSGIYHVLSISGLHMSLAVMLVFVSVRFLLSLYPPFALRYNIKKIASVIGLLSSFAYLMLAGYPVPAVRSFIMVACVMVAILCDRRGISIYSIGWAATLVMLWQPESILGASFELSFAATLGILAFFENCNSLLHKPTFGWLHKIWLYFFGIMLTSLVATLTTTPLVIYHFNRFTLWGIAANMLMIPLASAWIMPAAVIAFLLMPFGLEHWPLVALDQGISLMMLGAHWFATLPYATISLPSPSFWGMILAVFGGLWLCIWRQHVRYLGIIAVIIGMATILLHQPYDMLISDDATKVAIRLTNGKLLFIRGRDSSFDAQMWLRAHGQESGEKLDNVEGSITTCDKQKCTLNIHEYKIVVGKGKNTDGICDGFPDIVVSSEYLDRNPECRKISLLFDKASLKQKGAVGLRFKNNKIELITVAELRGERPWVAQHYAAAYYSLSGQSELSKTNNAAMMQPQNSSENPENSLIQDSQ